MIINGHTLLKLAPIKDMSQTKQSNGDVSYGMSEAGYDIRVKQDIFFNTPSQPVRFQLASSIEEFDMPDRLVGIVHDKSTWARRGLSVFNTVIEPGWKGFLTLELVYHGQGSFHIPAGSGIAQVIFHEALNRTQYTGKYQNQEDSPVAARKSLST